MTDEQLQYLREHMNDRPRTRVMRKLGVSPSTFMYYVHKFGGNTIDKSKEATERRVRIVAENYGHMTGGDIDRKYGFSKGYSNYIARNVLHIQHGEEAKRRILEKHLKNVKQTHTPENRDKAARRYRLTRKMEMMRFLSGQPQKTKFRFSGVPRGVYGARWQLMRNYGYIESTDPYTLLYDSTTLRRPERGGIGSEEYYTKRYGLKFMEDRTDDDEEERYS